MSGVLSFLSTIVALAILIAPFLVLPFQMAIVAAFLTGVTALFGLGMYVGKVSDKNMVRTGLVYAALGILGALISYFVGDGLRHLTGIA
jgi:predicted membrane protein (TIGR00267 family)